MGFYSAFLVSDRVTVETRSYAEDKAYVWESEAGAHSYKVSVCHASGGCEIVGGLLGRTSSHGL